MTSTIFANAKALPQNLRDESLACDWTCPVELSAYADELETRGDERADDVRRWWHQTFEGIQPGDVSVCSHDSTVTIFEVGEVRDYRGESMPVWGSQTMLAQSSTFRRKRYLSKFGEGTPGERSVESVDAKDFTIGRVYKSAAHALHLVGKYFPELSGRHLWVTYSSGTRGYCGVVGTVEAEPARESRVNEERLAKARAAFEVGSILCNSWGYDQTNVDFYEVVRVSASKATCWIRPIAQRTVRDTGSMSAVVAPLGGRFTGPEEQKRIGEFGVSFTHGGGGLPVGPDHEAHATWYH